MPSKGKKFLTEFLLPNLCSEKFGSKLKWVDKEKNIFQLEWSHKAGTNWKEADAVVFTEWDKMKGHYRPKDKEYYTKSKQRFRAVLYKLINEKFISEVPSNNKGTKIYHISREEYGVNSIFKFPSSYSFESHLGSITSDHSYSLLDPIISGNENIDFYPTQNNLLCKDLVYQRREESTTETSNLLFNPLEILNITDHWISLDGSFYQLNDFDSSCETA